MIYIILIIKVFHEQFGLNVIFICAHNYYMKKYNEYFYTMWIHE